MANFPKEDKPYNLRVDVVDVDEIYPPRESLVEAEPRLNFPKEDKPHNLRIYVVDRLIPQTKPPSPVSSWIRLLGQL